MVRVRWGGELGARALAGIVAAALVSSCGPGGAATHAGGAAAAAKYDWLQFDGDPAHSGNNVAEATISAQNASSLRSLFQVTLPAVADGAPVVLTGVTTAGGVRDLVFVATTAGHLVALDAATGATVWSVQNGPGTCRVNRGSAPCYTTSSPAVDPNRQYVYAYGLEGRVHKYAVGTGAEIVTGGWPQLVTNKPWDEKMSPPLVFATDATGTTHLYVANGGYVGDAGDYQGHVTAIDLGTGAQQVFNTLCSDQTVHFVASPGTPDCPTTQSAVWARAAMVYDAGTGRIFGATGNGLWDPTRRYWGDSVFALAPDGTGSGGNPLDTYTPTNQATLDSADLDLGSTSPAILPGSGARYPHLGAQSGKDSKIRLLDLSNLSGQGGPGHLGGELALQNVPQGGEVLTHPAVWVNPADGVTWLFLANGNGISGLSLSIDAGGTPSLVQRWVKSGGGTSPLVANGVLYYAGSSHLRALDPTTGNLLFDGTTIGAIHWQSPVVANGVVYVADQSGRLSAFGVAAATPDFAIAAAPSSLSVAQGASGTSTITITPSGGFSSSVALSASGLPAGVAATFSPASTTGASTLTLTASSTAAAGAATVTITGTSGTLSHVATVSLTVTVPQAPDFAIAAAPSSLSVAQGASGTSTITITPSGGFSGSVALSASGLPAGVAATFSPASTTGASTLTLTASSTATAGAAAVTITGTSGTLSHVATVSLTVTVPQAGGFTLTAAPTALTISQGAAQLSTLTISRAGGFTGSVAFSVSGLPAGVTAVLDQASTAGASDFVTFRASTSAAPGTSTATVTGTSGSLVRSATVALTIAPAGGRVLEAEAMTLSGAVVESNTSASGGNAVRIPYGNWGATSTAATTYPGTAGVQTMTIFYYDENSGSARWQVSIAGRVVDSWVADKNLSTAAAYSANASNRTSRIVPGVTVNPGDAIVVQCTADLKDWCNLDDVTFSASSASPDFALAAAPSSLAVLQGASASSTITVSPAGGFAGSVALSASGLPAGVTAAFSPASTTGASTLTLAASSTATTGTATVTVTGTSGSLTHSTTVALTVNAPVPADFALSASPTSLSLVQGGSAASTITVAPSGGFAGSVALTASGLPAGVTATFSPASTTGASTLTLAASSTGATGNATVTVSGTSGSLTHSTTVALTVSAPPTTDFTLATAPASLTVSQGTGQSSTLSIGRAGGFTGSVALAVSGLPAGVSAVLDQATTTGTSDFVTFYASATAAPGSSTVTITGTSGSLVHGATVVLTVAPAGTVLWEAEAMTLSGAVVELNTSASGNDAVRIPFGNWGATSTATMTYSGAAVTRTLTVFYYDENYGSARWQVSVGGRAVDAWVASQNLSTAAAYSANALSRTSRIISGVALNPGDTVVVQCTADLKDWCNLDDLTVQ